MRITIVLSPNEEADVFFRRLGTFDYTITSGRGADKKTNQGQIIVSPDRTPSPSRTIVARDDDVVEAPNPMVIRTRKNVTWVNARPRQIRIVMEPQS